MKNKIVVSNQVRLKKAQSQEILDLERRGIVLYPCSKKKGADQLCSYCKADLRLCFCICKMLVFSGCGSNGDFCLEASGIQKHKSLHV